VGCGSDGLDDLRTFVKNAHADRKPNVEPIPEMKPNQTFIYAATDLPDPFSASSKMRSLQPQTASGPKPDMNRRKQALEEYPLDALKMVGTLSRGKETWAVIQAPDGSVHRAQTGSYIGQNFGKVIKITEEKIELVELIPGSVGGWVEREAILAVPE
jgi:type IV pilus assembly protein PilP